MCSPCKLNAKRGTLEPPVAPTAPARRRPACSRVLPTINMIADICLYLINESEPVENGTTKQSRGHGPVQRLVGRRSTAHRIVAAALEIALGRFPKRKATTVEFSNEVLAFSPYINSPSSAKCRIGRADATIHTAESVASLRESPPTFPDGRTV